MLKESEGKNCQEIAKEGSSLESEQSPIICHLGSETKKLSCWGHADYNMPFWEAHFLCIIFFVNIFNNLLLHGEYYSNNLAVAF